MTVPDVVWATLSVLLLTASVPFYVYGALIVLDSAVVTWATLVRHLKYIGTGLVLTTAPILLWMLPRFVDLLGARGYLAVHAIVGMQAYALLLVALTGIVPLFRAKYELDLYRDPDQDVDLDDIHENVDAWRLRLRIGVFGFLTFWAVSYLLGLAYYVLLYVYPVLR